jgi:hypothetical protein
VLAVLAIIAAGELWAADPSVIAPAHRLDPQAAEWRALVTKVAESGDVVASFEERRVFPFRGEPVVLRGEVRVSPARGLSLHYVAPQARTIIIDAAGFLVRESEQNSAPPPDPRANLANEALRSIMRMDFATLARDYELYGTQNGETWSLGLVPRDAGTRRAIGNILVNGEGGFVRRIELRRSARQHVTIAMDPPRRATFSDEELRKYFR